MIKRCKDLLLIDFVECINGNLSVLGKGSDIDLQQTWTEIWAEYCELTDNFRFIKLLKLMRELTLIKGKITTIDLCLSVLSRYRSEDCIIILREYGYNYEYGGELIEDLIKVRAKSKVLLLNLRQKTDELEQFRQESEDVNRQDFSENIVAVSKYMGYRINPREVYVNEFAAMIKLIQKQAKQNG